MAAAAGFSYPSPPCNRLPRMSWPTRRGASACEVDVSGRFGQSVTVRCGEVETIEYKPGQGRRGHHLLPASARATQAPSDFSQAALRDTVRAAARYRPLYRRRR